MLSESRPSQGPLFTADDSSSALQYPPGYDVNDHMSEASATPVPSPTQMEQPGVIYNRGESLTPDMLSQIRAMVRGRNP